MIKKLTLIILILLLNACGSEQDFSTSSKLNVGNKSADNHVNPCDVLSENYIKSTFAGSNEIKSKETKSTHPFCGVSFKVGTVEYNMHITLGATSGADIRLLEASMSYFKKKKSVKVVSGVGEKAYTRSGMSGQLSTVGNGSLIHVAVFKSNKYDLALTKNVANDMLEILAKR
jgi:hypothetical protein